MNFTTELIFCNIQFKKSHTHFVERTRAMLTSGLAYKYIPSLQR